MAIFQKLKTLLLLTCVEFAIKHPLPAYLFIRIFKFVRLLLLLFLWVKRIVFFTLIPWWSVYLPFVAFKSSSITLFGFKISYFLLYIFFLILYSALLLISAGLPILNLFWLNLFVQIVCVYIFGRLVMQCFLHTSLLVLTLQAGPIIIF
jgi:hypothetical protein